MELQAFYEQFKHWLVTDGLRILLIIVLTFAALIIARVISQRIFLPLRKKLDVEMNKRAQTLGSLISYILSIAIIAVAIVMILDQFGIEIGPIIAAAGIAGLAIGFGAQQLVQDIISGFFILVEDQIRVGDVVDIAGKGGLVESVSLRIVVLRDLSGNVHYVRNSQINIVTNMTKEFSYYIFDIGVAYRENTDEVVEAVKQVDEDMRRDPQFNEDILAPIEILGLDKFADSAVIIKARIKTKPIKQWGVGREFNRRLKKKFDELDIEIPFPHMTVYMGKDKQGNAPPLNVNMAGK
jgi:small-conductance mechanosensitive channel